MYHITVSLHTIFTTIVRHSNGLGTWHEDGASESAQRDNLSGYERETHRIACVGSALMFILTWTAFLTGGRGYSSARPWYIGSGVCSEEVTKEWESTM